MKLFRDVVESDIGGFAAVAPLSAAPRVDLPQQGFSWADIKRELIAKKKDDFDWRGGRLHIYTYFDSDELLSVAREAYSLYFSENALGRKAFPSLATMEDDVVNMALGIFNAPAGSAGSFTSGGTESIFLALKSARDRFRTLHGRDVRPNVVLPQTAHPAFDKAAHFLDVDCIRIPALSDYRADVTGMHRALNGRTMLLVGSAPCYPFGVFDPIRSLSEVAAEQGVWMHVDACLGGFLAPFARAEGFAIPDFDFSIPGVWSLSADLHKFGFAARGASVLLYRSAELKAFQPFEFDQWPRGTYSTETFQGSRPGGAVAAAWAVMNFLGHVGYKRLASKTMRAAESLRAGVARIPGLEVLSPHELNVVVYRSIDPGVDIHAVADTLVEKGWFVGRMRDPEALHLALNAVHATVVERYLDDLCEAVVRVRDSGRIGKRDDRTY